MEQQTADKLKKHVHETFNHIRKALDLREHLLNRQIDVFLNNTSQQQPLVDPPSSQQQPQPQQLSTRSTAKCHPAGGAYPRHLKFMPLNETAVLEHIRRLGKFNVYNYIFHTDPTFAIEDYICPNVDHDLMYKCLMQNDSEIDAIHSAGHTTNAHVDEVAECSLEFGRIKVMSPKSMNTTAEGAAMNASAAVAQPTSKLNLAEPSKSTKKNRKSKRKIKKHIGCVAGVGAITINTISTMCSRENSIKSKSKLADKAEYEPNSKDVDPNQLPPHRATSFDAPKLMPNDEQTIACVSNRCGTPSTVPSPLLTTKSTSDMIMESHSTMEIASRTSANNRKQQHIQHHQPHNHSEYDRGDVFDGVDGRSGIRTGLAECSGSAGAGPTIDYGCSFYDRLLIHTPAQMLSNDSCRHNSTLPLAFVSVPGSLPSVPLSVSSHPTNESFSSIRMNRTSVPRVKSTVTGVSSRITDDIPKHSPLVQIEQWLEQIGNEPEQEPVPSTDLLENSLIHTERL